MLIKAFLKKIRPQVPEYWHPEVKAIFLRMIEDAEPGQRIIGGDGSFRYASGSWGSVDLFNNLQRVYPVEMERSHWDTFVDELREYSRILIGSKDLEPIYQATFTATITGLYAGGTDLFKERIVAIAHETAEAAIASIL